MFWQCLSPLTQMGPKHWTRGSLWEGRWIPSLVWSLCLGHVTDMTEILALISPRAWGGMLKDASPGQRWRAHFHKLWGIWGDALGYSEDLPALRRERAASVQFAHPLRPALGSEIVWVLRQWPSQRMPCRCVYPHKISPCLGGSSYKIYCKHIYPYMPIIAWLLTSKRCLGERLPPRGTLPFEPSVHFSIGAD